MNEKMLQWWVKPGPEGGVVEQREVDLPHPGEGEVLVSMRGAGINRGELIARAALRSDNPRAKAYPSGIEFCGEIVAIGPGIIPWAVGDRVMGRGAACHAEFIVAPVDALMPVPGHLTSDEAAAIPNVYVTAHDALVTAARTGPSDRVMITAGSSGVGSAAIQIARYLGCSDVAATTRSADKVDALLQLGATSVHNTSDPQWKHSAVGADGLDDGFDVIIDQVGGALFPDLLQTMAIRGRYVSVGRNDGPSATLDLDALARKRLELIGVTFRTRTAAEALACSKRFADQLLGAFDSGQLTPVLDRSFPLISLPEAHDYMMSDTQIGKIVLSQSGLGGVSPAPRA